MDTILNPVSAYEGTAGAALIAAGCVRVSVGNSFRYADGTRGPVFCSLAELYGYNASPRPNPSPPDVIDRLLPLAFGDVCSALGKKVDGIVAVVSGGINPASAIRSQRALPQFTVRTSLPDDHNEQVEGGSVEGKTLIVIEDVVRTGNTGSLRAVKILKEWGADVPAVLSVVDYRFKNTHERFRNAGTGLYSLTSLPVILAMMHTIYEAKGFHCAEDGEATPATMAVIRAWYDSQGGLEAPKI